MVGNANVPDFALGLGLQHRLIQSGAIARLGAERRRMKLIQINVVGPEVFQAGLQVLPKGLSIGSAGLGRNGNFVPYIR